MKRFSTAILAAAALAGGATALAVTPAVAQKKKGGDDAKGPAYTKEVALAYNKGKTALEAKDMATAEAAAAEAEAAAKTDDDRYLAATLRYVVIGQKIAASSAATNGVADSTPMIAPLDSILANPKTPPDLIKKFAFSRGNIAYEQKDYATAITMLTRARTAGSTEANLPLLLAQAKVRSGDVPGGLAELETLTTAGKQSEDIYKYGISQANKAGNIPLTVKWFKLWMTAYPTAKTWREAIGAYAFARPPVAKLNTKQMIDVYRLLRASKTMADQSDYEDYAQRAMDVGLPEEAKAVIAEGKASGKIPGAGSAGIVSLTASSNAQATGNFSALESKASASTTGALSQQTGDAYLGAGNYAKAITLYRQALTKGVTDTDDVNTHLGIALALTGDKEGAKAAFNLVKGAPRADIAAFWVFWLDSPPTI